jgi:putative Ca2+/H+ antiporter (TMEM165/GDT1 family)
MAYGALGHGETNVRTSGTSGGGSAVVRRPLRSPTMEAFLVSISTVALAEMGDRTQLLSLLLATLALAAGYPNLFAVVAGTTCGMIAANAPVVFLGNVFVGRLPMRAIHFATTLLLLVIGAVFIIRAIRHWS